MKHVRQDERSPSLEERNQNKTERSRRSCWKEAKGQITFRQQAPSTMVHTEGVLYATCGCRMQASLARTERIGRGAAGSQTGVEGENTGIVYYFFLTFRDRVLLQPSVQRATCLSSSKCWAVKWMPAQDYLLASVSNKNSHLISICKDTHRQKINLRTQEADASR